MSGFDITRPESIAPPPAATEVSQAVPAPDTVASDRPHAADGVPLNWQPGDVILDLYEVRPLNETHAYLEGGMGRVNRVWHRGWQQDLAVKSVNPLYLQRS